jgi:AbrB family looped-hinge helix DNA binding protein
MRVGEKGQVTIPIERRRALGLHAGSEVEFERRGQDAKRRTRRTPHRAPARAEQKRSVDGRAARPDPIVSAATAPTSRTYFPTVTLISPD